MLMETWCYTRSLCSRLSDTRISTASTTALCGAQPGRQAARNDYVSLGNGGYALGPPSAVRFRHKREALQRAWWRGALGSHLEWHLATSAACALVVSGRWHAG